MALSNISEAIAPEDQPFADRENHQFGTAHLTRVFTVS